MDVGGVILEETTPIRIDMFEVINLVLICSDFMPSGAKPQK